MSAAVVAILDAIATAAAAIDGAAPYTTTVKVVNEVAVNRLNQHSAKGVAITLIEREIEPRSEDNDIASEIFVLSVDVVGTVALTKDQVPHKATLPLLTDVRRMVRSNRTWSGSAINSELGTVSFFAGEAEAEFVQNLRVTFVESAA